jgi:uncharacterized damage-inducible protein DinB
MTAYTTLLEEVLEAWAVAREGVIAEVENLDRRGLEHRATRGARTAGEIALHIVEVGLMWCGELTRADGDFRRKPYDRLVQEYAGHLPAHASQRALVALLRRTHKDGDARIRRAGELHFLQPIRRFDGKVGTRLAWLNHGVAHEEYHRGQVALCARLAGEVPALTKLIEG